MLHPAWLISAIAGDGFKLLAGSGLGHLAALLPAQLSAGQLAQVTLDHLQLPPGLLHLVAALGAGIGRGGDGAEARGADPDRDGV